MIKKTTKYFPKKEGKNDGKSPAVTAAQKEAKERRAKRAAANSLYVSKKITHMVRFGIAAGIGQYGGACPDWLKAEREENEKVRAKRLMALRESARRSRLEEFETSHPLGGLITPGLKRQAEARLDRDMMKGNY